MPYDKMLSEHCLTLLSAHQVMLIGGRTYNEHDVYVFSAKTFVYDFKDDTWTSGPEMSYARAGLDCTSKF